MVSIYLLDITLYDVLNIVGPNISPDTKCDCAALTLYLPQISISSADSNNLHLFEDPLPVSHTSSRLDTLPWTLTMTDFAILTFLSHRESTLDGKMESCYICKPVSCKVFLATSSNSKNTYKSKRNTFSENSFENKHNVTDMPTQAEKLVVVGFVLHADWSSCYLYLNKSQVCYHQLFYQYFLSNFILLVFVLGSFFIFIIF